MNDTFNNMLKKERNCPIFKNKKAYHVLNPFLYPYRNGERNFEINLTIYFFLISSNISEMLVEHLLICNFQQTF